MTDLASGRNANFKPISVLESLNCRIEHRQRINGRNNPIHSSATKTSAGALDTITTSATKTSTTGSSTDHYRAQHPIAPASDKGVYRSRNEETDLFNSSLRTMPTTHELNRKEVPGKEKFEMEKSEKLPSPSSTTPDSSPCLTKRGSGEKSTRPSEKSTRPSESRGGDDDLKASALDTLTQLDPQALLLIQSVVRELNLTKEAAAGKDQAQFEPVTLTPQQLIQLKQQLTKLAGKKTAQNAAKGTPPPYNANHNTSNPAAPVKKSIEEEILQRLSSRLSIISEITEPEEISERDITYNSEPVITDSTNYTGDVILSDCDDTLDGSDAGDLEEEDDRISSIGSIGSSNGMGSSPDEPPAFSNPLPRATDLPPAVVHSPSPPLPPQAFRNTPPRSPQPPATPRPAEVTSSRANFKAAKNKGGTQRAFGMNFSTNYKINKGTVDKDEVAPSENAISLYVDDPDDGMTSDGESEVVRISSGLVSHTSTTRETDRGHRTPLPLGATQTLSQRVPPVGADDKTRKQLDLQRKAVLQNSARSSDSSFKTRDQIAADSGSRDDTNSSCPSSPRATPVSMISSNSSITSRSNVARAHPRSDVSGKSDAENRRSDNISGKSDNSDRESSGSKTKRSSPFMYGKTNSNRSTSPANSGYAQLSVRSSGDFSDSKSKDSTPNGTKEPVPPARTKATSRAKDKEQAQDIIRKNTQEIRRLGFGRNSYQPPSSQPVTPNRGSHGRASFDENTRRSPGAGLRQSTSARRLVYEQGRNSSDSGDKSRCEPLDRQDDQRQSSCRERRASQNNATPPSPRVSERSRHHSPQQQEAETVFPPTPTSVRKMNVERPQSRGKDYTRPLSYGAPRTEEPKDNGYSRSSSVVNDQYFDQHGAHSRNRYVRGPADPAQDGTRLYHSLDKRQLRRRTDDDERTRSNLSLGSPSYQHTRQDHQPPNIPPRAPMKPDNVYENVAKLQSNNRGSRCRGGMVSLHADSSSDGSAVEDESEVEDDLTRICEPDYRKEAVCPSSPIPRDVHNWLRDTINHARLDSGSNTTSVEDNVKSDGRCPNESTSSTERKTETKPVNGKVKGYHFDIDAAVAKLKIKKDIKLPIVGDQITDVQKNSSLCNYYNPNLDNTLPGKNSNLSSSNRKVTVPHRYMPSSHSEDASPQQHLMNNPMQFIDVAHEKNVLLDMYSDQLSLLESNMSDMFEESKDPGNLHRLILKHLIKAQNESSDTLLPNMKSQKLLNVQPDYTSTPYYKQTKKRMKNPVSDPENFRCIGKIIYSTTGKVKVIELYRPHDGYFGFQISPTMQDNKLRVFISGFGHGLTDKLFTGLLAVGDEVLNVNGHSVGSKSFTEVISILSMSQTLLLTIKSNDPKFHNTTVHPQPVPPSVSGRRTR